MFLYENILKYSKYIFFCRNLKKKYEYFLVQEVATRAISASKAQFDVHQAGDQEVVGSIPSRSCNILSWRLIMKYFLVILFLTLIQEEQLLVSGERMCSSTC